MINENSITNDEDILVLLNNNDLDLYSCCQYGHSYVGGCLAAECRYDLYKQSEYDNLCIDYSNQNTVNFCYDL